MNSASIYVQKCIIGSEFIQSEDDRLVQLSTCRGGYGLENYVWLPGLGGLPTSQPAQTQQFE